MDKKSIIWIVILGILVIFYWPILQFLGLVEPGTDATEIQQTTTDTIGQLQGEGPGFTEPTDLNYANQPAATNDLYNQSNPESAYIPPADSIKADTIVVTTNTYTVILSSYGGGPLSIKLNKFAYRNGEPIELLPSALSVVPEASFAGGSFTTSSLYFSSNLIPGNYDVRGEPLELIYTHRGPNGATIERKFIFSEDEHAYEFSLSVSDPAAFGLNRAYEIIWNNPLQPTEPNLEADYQAMEVVAMMGGSRENLNDYEDGRLNQKLTGDVTWAGLRSKYFATIIIPRNRMGTAVSARGIESEIITTEGTIDSRLLNTGIEMEFVDIRPINDSFTVFVGPLDYMTMSDYNVGLQDMLDIGTTPVIGILIKPFAIAVLWLLPKLYSFIPNYGIVIILFAVLVKLITLPLSMKSFKSMQAMKDLQPKIDEMKTRYKKDPQKLNKEMMKMYKQHGVNPISGCLPIIPQMPVFFAMFSVFRSTILLREAPFVWFIDDLSRGAQSFTDPYIILVLIMVGAQFVSTKFTMASTQQNKGMIYIMPLFMGFFFYSFAAGLVLYWTSFSLLSLVDYLLFKRDKNPEVKKA